MPLQALGRRKAMAGKHKAKKAKKKNSGSGSGPRLSLVMIAKNEEANLPRALASAQALASEIILVDTGSSDSTVEIAQSFGAQVYHHPWQNDFALHRNQALSHATGDWCLQLDADEELAPASGPLIKKLIKDPRPAAYTVEMINLVAGQEATRSHLIRLFRNQPGVRYHRRVHNQLRIPGPVAPSRVTMRHYGYDQDPQTMAAKQQRRLQMIRAWAAEQPEDFEAHFYLAQTLAPDLASAPEAVSEALTALKLAQPQPGDPPLKMQAFDPLLRALYSLGRHQEVMLHARQWAVLAPHNPDPYCFLADGHFRLGQYELTQAAAGRYLQLLEQVEKQPQLYAGIELITLGQRQHVAGLWQQARAALAGGNAVSG